MVTFDYYTLHGVKDGSEKLYELRREMLLNAIECRPGDKIPSRNFLKCDKIKNYDCGPLTDPLIGERKWLRKIRSMPHLNNG